MDWRHRASCRDEDPELFYPMGNGGPALLQIVEAKSVCRRCPVFCGDQVVFDAGFGQVDWGKGEGLQEDRGKFGLSLEFPSGTYYRPTTGRHGDAGE